MKKLIVREFLENDILEMARVGFIPVGSNKTIEVYVHTDDPGKVPHFHVRKYGKDGRFDWETCIRYDSPEYFFHGKYKDKLPDRKIAKQLDTMLRTINTKSRSKSTFWEECVDEWNRNNSDVQLDINIDQPDYTQL